MRLRLRHGATGRRDRVERVETSEVVVLLGERALVERALVRGGLPAEDAEEVPGWLAQASPTMPTNAAAAATPSFCLASSARCLASSILEGRSFMRTGEQRHLKAA